MHLIPAELVFLISVAGLSQVDPPAPSSQPDDQQVISNLESAVQSLIAGAAPSLVAIRANRSPLSSGDIGADAAPPFVTGSGVIIRPDGVILTCHHVIKNAATIEATLHDGRRVRARLVAQDPRDDLAILKIATDDLRAAPIVEVSPPVRGSIVVALGFPFGASPDGHASASLGIVSAVGRAIPDEFCRDEDRYFGDMIQATVALQPGCSGGALFDRKNRLIGILSVRGGDAGTPASAGFAIPINHHTRPLISRMVAGESIEYAYLGVDVAPPIDMAANAAGRTPPSGVRVVRVWDDGPARNAGLRPGDVIRAIDEALLESPDQFVRLMGQLAPGHMVRLRVNRNNVTREVEVQLAARQVSGPQRSESCEVELRGATLSRIEGGLPAMVGVDGQAMMVVRVEAESAADRAGITPGDIIVGLEGRPIRVNPDEWPADPRKDLLIGLASGASVLVKADEE